MGKMLDFVTKKTQEHPVKTLLDKVLVRFGNAPDVIQQNGYVFVPVPRESIEQSEKAVRWLSDFIAELEASDDGESAVDAGIMEALKGTYFVFRDCSLMAKHYLKFRDEQEPRCRKHDILFRFNEDPKDKNMVQLSIGYAEKEKPQ